MRSRSSDERSNEDPAMPGLPLCRPHTADENCCFGYISANLGTFRLRLLVAKAPTGSLLSPTHSALSWGGGGGQQHKSAQARAPRCTEAAYPTRGQARNGARAGRSGELSLSLSCAPPIGSPRPRGTSGVAFSPGFQTAKLVLGVRSDVLPASGHYGPPALYGTGLVGVKSPLSKNERYMLFVLVYVIIEANIVHDQNYYEYRTPHSWKFFTHGQPFKSRIGSHMLTAEDKKDRRRPPHRIGTGREQAKEDSEKRLHWKRA
ncbi:hypothetical protein EDB87DRAFT_1825089 [Lactarius vividus]|nr:hypothetical protein EDB87DRAFT_1825089 [Lactarius vividus]